MEYKLADLKENTIYLMSMGSYPSFFAKFIKKREKENFIKRGKRYTYRFYDYASRTHYNWLLVDTIFPLREATQDEIDGLMIDEI